MIIAYPGQILRLAIIYQESGIITSGLTDLTVEGRYDSGEVILIETSLVEKGSEGEYYFLWDSTGIVIEEKVTIYYKKGSLILDVEEYYFDILEDSDGKVL
jgi:hypothetical protein